MINRLEVKRFKSILALGLDCRRVNVLIGEPNTGKSNLLEALGLLSFAIYGDPNRPAGDFVRFERVDNLFYDEVLDDPLEVRADTCSLSLRFQGGGFAGSCTVGEKVLMTLAGNHEHLPVQSRPSAGLPPIKSYRFRVRSEFPGWETGFLMPPSGDNLALLLLARRELQEAVGALFETRGMRLRIRRQEKRLELDKRPGAVVVAFPYSIASDTLQRIAFFTAAVLSNQDSVLVFEEPEAHAFPYYTKYLAELIALDQRGNQYFISMHNPHLLEALVEKCPTSEIAVHLVYYEDDQTKVKTLEEAQLAELSDVDVFWNIDRYLGKL
ncbi:MAG: AAA family ATPase [Chloroflexi bacterium]|nr:AAA family ATPase [Chloroflexota bacterium]